MSTLTATEIWKRYQNGRNYLNRIRLESRTKRAHQMTNGDQWSGLKNGGEEMPQHNFIKGLVKYKTTIVAQNPRTAIFAPTSADSEEEAAVTEKLTAKFAQEWELGKMDTVAWKLAKFACIQGDSYLYWGGKNIEDGQIVQNYNVILADETNPNLQEQKYIILYERLYVDDVKRIARESGVSEYDISLITSDSGADYKKNMTEKTGEIDEKVSVIRYYYKDDDGVVHSVRGTQNIIIEPDEPIRTKDVEGNHVGVGLKSYPVVSIIWEEMVDSARGAGEVEALIPNQIELNKTLARRVLAVKQAAFPKLAYDENAVLDPSVLDTVGAKIAVKNGQAQDINKMISYLNPSGISSDAMTLTNDLLHTTRELAGAGDAALGSVDPTKASGSAIMAARDQAALPLNEQVGRFTQLIEDIARVRFDIWVAYTDSEGLSVVVKNENDEEIEERVSVEELEGLKVRIKIDVTQRNPFSTYAQEQALSSLLQAGHISFEEYIEAINADSSVPRAKMQELFNKRKAGQKDEAIQQLELAMQQMQEQEQIIAEMQQQLEAVGAETETYRAKLDERARAFENQKYRENELKIKELEAKLNSTPNAITNEVAIQEVI